MFGAWGKAISNTNGTLYQLRALDWSTDGPFQQVRNTDRHHLFALPLTNAAMLH
jgi:hypothetical protein